MDTNELYLGYNIGGTKCSVVLGDKNFNILDKVSFPTNTKRGYAEILNEFKEHTFKLLSSYGQDKLIKIGISCGGPLDSTKGVIYSPPNLPGWDAVPIVDIVKAEFGVEVEVQNDANASALAEWMMGGGKGTRNMIFLTFGTGMGAGLILNGQLYAGTNDLGGEVGHIRMEDTGPVGFGKAGSFEGFCSGGGIAQLASTIITQKLEDGQTVGFCPTKEGAQNITAKDVFEAANDGDPVAMQIVEISAKQLGKGLAILIDILNPERIVIGSIYTRNKEVFDPIINEMLEKEAIPAANKVCKIVPAALGESIGDYAALCVALN
ncbi:MAG: ROK family protein [Bacteroidota bacterium]